MMKTLGFTVSLLGLVFFFSACVSTSGGNDGVVQSFPILGAEADWIRNGEPIEYEDEKWYPQDGTESLMDSEVYVLGEHRGVQYFVDKLDVRPVDRIYTKFGRNKFRYFEKLNEQ